MTDVKDSGVYLRPFNSVCNACGFDQVEFRFCTQRCQEVAVGRFESAPRMGDRDHPHLHKKCARCGFEWLEHCLYIDVGEGDQVLVP